jgi:acyl-coenzyme A thioesterase 9
MQSILSHGLHQEIMFDEQVDVGDFLRIKSCVLYTEHEDSEKPLINIEVVAHVTRPELRSSEVGVHIPFRVIATP